MKCCGNTKYTDYALQNNLPKSCCGLEPDSQTPCTDTHEGLIKKGCKSEIGSAIDLVNKVLGFFGMFIVIILVSLVLSIKHWRKDAFPLVLGHKIDLTPLHWVLKGAAK